MSHLTRETFRLNSLLALALVASGALALLTASPAGYVSPIFPPAGIALAAWLVHRSKVIWGISLSAIGISLLAQWNSGNPEINIGLALAGAIGPILQPIIGALLMRGLGVWPSGLDRVRQVVLFVCAVTPGSCLISATLSLPLAMAGDANIQSAPFNSWLMWWTGDALGILLFTPITLAIIGRPAQEWRDRWRGVAVPLMICAIVMTCAIQFVHRREENRTANDFNLIASQLAYKLSARFAAQMDMLMTIDRYASTTRSFSKEDWAKITQPWLDRYPGTQNLTWDPLVKAEDRARFETQMRQDGIPDFHIYDRTTSGQTYLAKAAPEYLPITLIEPLAGNSRAIGVNVLSLPMSMRTIKRSRLTGKAAATEAIRLVQLPESPQSVVLYQAVFESADDINSPMKGVVSIALNLNNVLQIVRGDLNSNGIELCLLDRSDPKTSSLIFGPSECKENRWLRDYHGLTSQIAFADRTWEFLLRGDNLKMAYLHSWASTAALAVALSFSGMLSAFLLLITGRTRRIEEQVSRRTAELAHATAQLRDQKASLSQAQRIARMGSWEFNHISGELHCSDEFRRLLGISSTGHLLLHDMLVQLELDDRNHLNAFLQEASAAPMQHALDCCMLAQGNERQILHFQIESEAVGGRILRVHGTAQDVTGARQAEAHIQYLARFDPLTGLPNRTHWQDLARTALRDAQRHCDQAAVLFLDLDHFKTINDSLGHNVGDLLLAAVAERLKHSLRSPDILARQGGDEFVLLLPRLNNPAEVHRVATKLIKTLAEPVQVQGHDLAVSVSIGISYYPDDGEDIDTLLKHADVAMYSAKQVGRNNFQFFIPAMNQRAMERLKMESSLRKAFERNEFLLHYQPQLDLPTQRINACEALVRWNHPDEGMIPPGQFIPLTEESGLIIPLGDWVLREACQQQVQWTKQGLDLTIAVNISALQFRQAGFAEKVAQIIREAGVSPRKIELELTESALLGTTEQLVESLEQLRRQGVTLALDDFGTGYSCLSYLKRLPIERLKIDRSFIKDLPGDAEDAAIASATLSMARDLGMKVVAEGVETQAQYDFLHARNCHSIQGYLISPALPAEQFLAWMQARETLQYR